jgi:hypothetical protein
MRPIMIALTLALCASASHAQPATRALTEAEKTVVRTAIGAELNDPDSAAYRWQDVKTVDLRPRYCVEVNAKNRYGGYVGFKPVMVQTTINNGVITGIEKVWWPDASVPEGLTFQISACRGYGYNVGG